MDKVSETELLLAMFSAKELLKSDRPLDRLQRLTIRNVLDRAMTELNKRGCVGQKQRGQ